MPQRCAYWPARRLLIAADLHLGKCDTLRAAGLSMPQRIASAVLHVDLARLNSALEESGAERLLVVGDLLHAPAGLTDELIGAVERWRAARPVPITLIAGNHDRRVERVRDCWKLDFHERELRDSPFLFAHDPAGFDAACGAFGWCGHVHPTVLLASGVDAVKLPSFIIERDLAILPAFSRFTAGAVVRSAPGRRRFAIAEGRILEV